MNARNSNTGNHTSSCAKAVSNCGKMDAKASTAKGEMKASSAKASTAKATSAGMKNCK